MTETQPKDRRTRAQLIDDLAVAQRPLVVENNRRGATGLGLVAAAVIGAGAALVLSGGVRFGGVSEPTGSFSPTATPSTSEAAGQASPEASNSFLIAIASEKPASLNSSEAIVGEKLAPGIKLPAVISSDMTRAFVPNVVIDGNKIPQYTDSEFFLTLSNVAKAEKGIWEPWAPIAIQNIDGKAHLKTEGNPGLFDIVADQPGEVSIYFTQLGAHQHETAINGNGESNPDWNNQYTLHLEPFQTVKVIDRNGKQVVWDDGKTPMVLAASEKGDFSIEVPRTANNEDVVFGLVIDVSPSQAGVQATAIKVQRGPNDVPSKTGENKFAKLGIQAIVIPAITEK